MRGVGVEGWVARRGELGGVMGEEDWWGRGV